MAIQTLSAIPARFTAGDTLIFTESFSDFPAPGWDLTLYLSLNGGTPVSVEASDSGTGHLITISAATSALLAPGRYRYALVATSGEERATVKEGIITVLPNFSIAQTLSTTALILADLEQTIRTLAADPTQTVNFSGQSYTNKDLPALYKMLRELKAELRSEQEALNPGHRDQGRVVTRFVNP